MGRCGNDTVRLFARDAMKRLSGGFWNTEYQSRREKLSAIKNSGGDTDDAVKFFCEQTKSQMKDHEDERLYNKARHVFMSVGVENALSAMIDKKEIAGLTDPERQRYVFSLSEKLQRYKERFLKEQEYSVTEQVV